MYAEAYANRGVASGMTGQYDKAIADYNKSIEINPRYVEPYLNKAIVCEKLGLTQEALEAYKGFIQYAPPQYGMYIEHAKQRISDLEGRDKKKGP